MRRRIFLKTMTGLSAMCMLSGFPLEIAAREKLKDSQWRGFNLLNYFTAGYPKPFDEEEFKWMRDWGFNFVRLPLSYWNWSKPGEYYQMDEKVLADIDNAVRWGQQYGIHVCINLHRAPGYCVNKPEEPENLFRDQSALDGCAYQWSVFARRYKEISSKHLSFNLLNEVADIPDAEYERVVRRLVSEIRNISPKRTIMIDGLQWGGRPLLTIEDLPRIIQCGRGYQPMLISHYEASWVFGDRPMQIPRKQLAWPLDADGLHYDRAWLEDMLRKAWTPLEKQGGHVFLGEFGCHNRTPHQVALKWLEDNLDVFKQNNWGWALWNLSGSFGIMDSGRSDVDYEDFHGHRLDRKMLDLILRKK
jgi:endoglucanase